MPIFPSLDLERMLVYQQKFFYGKVLFFTQLSYHLMCKLLKKSYMLSITYSLQSKGEHSDKHHNLVVPARLCTVPASCNALSDS
jgi:hypothetical protein